MRAENEGKITTKTLIPAAFLASNPSDISVGINKNPGPTPRKRAKTEIGTPRIIPNLKFASPHLSFTGLKSR